MGPSEAVLVCALELLGRSRATAPIELLATPPPQASRNVEAFVTRNPDTIYLITSTAVFQDALNQRWPDSRRVACRKLASIIVHEEWHLRYGQDEEGAYQAQLMMLQVLGADTQTISSVRRSMLATVRKHRSQRPTALSAISIDATVGAFEVVPEPELTDVGSRGVPRAERSAAGVRDH